MKQWLVLILILLLAETGRSQGPSLSEDDLLRSYLEKRQDLLHTGTKQFTADEQSELDRLETTLKENYPDAYSTHLVVWLNGNYNLEKKTSLFRAYELDPDAKEVVNEMFAYYIITGDVAKQKEFAGRIKSQYSTNTLNYYRDLLPLMGIVVTSNYADSYPLYILQLLHSEGSELLIVNMEFLRNESYKTRIQREAEIGTAAFVGNEDAWLTKLLSASTKTVTISSTVNQAYLSMTESLYLTGLGYEYNPKDQRKKLDAFWNKVKTRDLASVQLTASEKKLYGNYLPALLTLYKLKLLNDEIDTLLKAGIEALATKVNKSETIDQILEDYETSR